MKAIKNILTACAGMLLLFSCEKKDYPAGLHEYDHHYYLAYIPNNNSQVSVNRSQSALLKFPVQFYSSFSRSYDAVAYYGINNTGIANPATVGVDFAIVDKNGNPIQPVNGKYSFTFPRAERAMDTIYVKLLNNPAAGTRKTEIQIMENLAGQYNVDIFSTAFRRPIEIK